MNTAVIVKRFDNAIDILNVAGWANGLIGDYPPVDSGMEGVIVNSIVSVQVISLYNETYLAVLLVEVWCPETENDPA